MIEFERLEVGQQAVLEKHVRAEDVDRFAALSGDDNPLHMDDAFARQTHFGKRVVHGMLLGSYVSTLIGTQLPGPGALWAQQTLRWVAPVFIDDHLRLTLTIKQKSIASRSVVVMIQAVNQVGKTVLEGEGTVMILDAPKRSAATALAERVTLVTGSSRGIGRAIALEFGAGGARVIVNYAARAECAEDVCQSICTAGGQAIAVRAPVEDARRVADMVRQAREHFGKPITVLVNNACGPIAPKPFSEMSWADVERHLQIQVGGAFHCATAVVPGMAEAKCGHIVNLGSIASWNVPPPNWMGYTISKAALRAMTRSLAVELGPKGIAVNMVSPGMTETELIAEIPERVRRVQAAQAPLRQLAVPEDIARTVVFLCASNAVITGADIPVCAGICM